MALESPCELCPRRCRASRRGEDLGFCGTPAGVAFVASFGPHHGEESFLRGRRGSGTVFFSGCNMRCLYCQNFDISQRLVGRPMGEEELSELFLGLGGVCHNLNLVSPTHVLGVVFRAVSRARGMGLSVPVVYNSGGYDRAEAIRLLKGLVDVYMPDFKYSSDELARRLSSAPGYVEFALSALEEMFRQVGPLEVFGGLAVRGVFVRHLVLPGLLENTFGVLSLLSENFPLVHLNLMDQYRPCYRAFEDPNLRRPLRSSEFEEALRFARGLRNLVLVE